MPFDAIAMAAVRDEAASQMGGGQIQRILQPSTLAVGVQVHTHGQTRWLVASADARFARVHLTADRLAKAFPTPSMFVMLLRKHLEGTRIASVEQDPYERILRLACGPEERRATLLIEVMGKHSNILLLDREQRILGAVKIVPPRQSRVRPVLPGHPYRAPPRRDRDAALYGAGPSIDPARESAEARTLLLAVPEGTCWEAALLGLFSGASPFLAAQIRARAGVGREDEVGPHTVDAVLTAACDLYALYGTREWQPYTFVDARGRGDFAPYQPVGVCDVLRARTIGEAIERCLGGQENRDVLISIRRAVAAEIDRALQAASRRLASLRAGLAAAEEADQVMRRGQLVLAYTWAVPPRADHLDLPELGVSIPLDPALSATENAERLFRRYRKLRDAAAQLPQLIAGAETELARLLDLRAFVDLADSEHALRELQRQIRGETEAVRPKRANARHGPPILRRDGAAAVVGRNARENEEVTFRIASRHDLWLHARERTGAHVVLRTAGGEIDPATVEAAAALAAYYSGGRADSAVDVDVASVRDVRRTPGGPPGRVTYKKFRTLRVRPSLDGWAPAAGAGS